MGVAQLAEHLVVVQDVAGSSPVTHPSRSRAFRSAVTPAGPPLDPNRVASYLVALPDRPIIAPSAFKHGLSREDILHAYWHPIRVWDLGDGFTMMVGPNRAALILEVGYVEGDVAIVIVHAMVAREKLLR